MFRRASISVRPTRFSSIVGNISQDDSFVGPSFSQPPFHIELDNYLKHYFEVEHNNFNVLDW